MYMIASHSFFLILENAEGFGENGDLCNLCINTTRNINIMKKLSASTEHLHFRSPRKVLVVRKPRFEIRRNAEIFSVEELEPFEEFDRFLCRGKKRDEFRRNQNCRGDSFERSNETRYASRIARLVEACCQKVTRYGACCQKATQFLSLV